MVRVSEAPDVPTIETLEGERKIATLYAYIKLSGCGTNCGAIRPVMHNHAQGHNAPIRVIRGASPCGRVLSERKVMNVLAYRGL
jgi:hypothetical protein